MKIIFADRTKEILNEMFAPDCETIKEFFDKEKDNAVTSSKPNALS